MLKGSNSSLNDIMVVAGGEGWDKELRNDRNRKKGINIDVYTFKSSMLLILLYNHSTFVLYRVTFYGHDDRLIYCRRLHNLYKKIHNSFSILTGFGDIYILKKLFTGMKLLHNWGSHRSDYI